MAHAGFVLDALEQAIHDRKPVDGGGLVHHSDRGSQYLSIKYTERLAEDGIETSVGSVGDSYDNAPAEAINGLYNAEDFHRRGPWRSFEAVGFATLEWVDWFSHRRLLKPLGFIPPAEARRALCFKLEVGDLGLWVRDNPEDMSIAGIAVQIDPCSVPVIIEMAALNCILCKIRVKQANAFATLMAYTIAEASAGKPIEI
jgi:hypothetical protein